MQQQCIWYDRMTVTIHITMVSS